MRAAKRFKGCWNVPCVPYAVTYVKPASRHLQPIPAMLADNYVIMYIEELHEPQALTYIYVFLIR